VGVAPVVTAVAHHADYSAVGVVGNMKAGGATTPPAFKFRVLP
jgi:uncharacterized protein YwlG (UPF0340 family)